jgi:hypothetical protein
MLNENASLSLVTILDFQPWMNEDAQGWALYEFDVLYGGCVDASRLA